MGSLQMKKKERKRLERRKPVNYLIHLTEVTFGEMEVRMYKFEQTACACVLPECQALARLWGREKKPAMFLHSHTHIKSAPGSFEL